LIIVSFTFFTKHCTMLSAQAAGSDLKHARKTKSRSL
jgi:hypothetical protein